MVSQEAQPGTALDVGHAARELASYVARHPNLRDDFILIARRDEAGDVLVITAGDVAGDRAANDVTPTEA